MRKILFVCSGNTCRSPMALAAWRALQKSGKAPTDIAADSAGLMASPGAPSSRHAIKTVRAWDQDLSTHRAKALSSESVRSVNWFAVMNASHALALQQYFDIEESKVLFLGAFDSQLDDTEILDPFGGSHEAYETCAARIHRAVEGLASAIERGEV